MEWFRILPGLQLKYKKKYVFDEKARKLDLAFLLVILYIIEIENSIPINEEKSHLRVDF